MLVSDDDQVLVIRFWREHEVTELSPPRHWRARITHVNSGQQFHAPSIDHVFDVVRTLLSTEKHHS